MMFSMTDISGGRGDDEWKENGAAGKAADGIVIDKRRIQQPSFPDLAVFAELRGDFVSQMMPVRIWTQGITSSVWANV